MNDVAYSYVYIAISKCAIGDIVIIDIMRKSQNVEFAAVQKCAGLVNLVKSFSISFPNKIPIPTSM